MKLELEDLDLILKEKDMWRALAVQSEPHDGMEEIDRQLLSDPPQVEAHDG